jgi:PAS domain S-box-containing protein
MTLTGDTDEEVLLHSVAMQNANSILVARLCAVDDLLAETNALQIERTQLAEAQALARIGSWRYDLHAKTATWSEECYRIFGMTPDEGGASNNAFFALVHPDDLDIVSAAVSAGTADGAAFVLDHRLLLADATVKWVQLRSDCLRDKEGRPVSAIGTIQDITERKSAEAALQQTQQLLRIASRVGRIGGWELDLSVWMISWSDEVCSIHGVPPGYRPTVEKAVDFYAPEFRERVRNSLTACVSHGTPFDIEAQIINVTGERVWVRVVGEADVERGGVARHIRGAFQDISERKSALRALRESDERFRLVAQAATDVVWDWNLVDDTCWWSDGLQATFGYSAADSMRESFWTDNIHVDDRQRVVDSVQAAIASGGPWLVEYRFRKADGAFAVIADRALVTLDDSGRSCRMLGAMVDMTQQRALEARLDHAERVSSAGRLAANMAHEFNNVLMGIQPFVEVIRRVTPDIPRAQDAVVRIAESVKRGKSITDEILRLTRRAEPVARPGDVRDWLLDFTSKAGALRTNAPAATSSPPSRVRDMAVEPPPAAAQRRLPKMILIVDDEAAVADGISMLLASEDVNTASVSEGAKAIVAITHHVPELVLLDIGLPDVSGVEVFKHIQERWPTLRVVIMTGHYDRADLASILELPHVGFLQKPFSADDLLNAIEN